MAPALLRAMSKRVSRTPSPSNSDDLQRPRQEGEGYTPSKRQESVAVDEVNVPADPQPIADKELKKQSSSRSLLHRYKHKTPLSKFATFAAADQQTDNNESKAQSESPRLSTEGIGQDNTATSAQNSMPTVRKVEAQGCEFDIMTYTNEQSADAANSIQHLPEKIRIPASERPTRSTRSSSRRQSRQDSLQDDDLASSKDIDVASAAAFSEKAKSTLQVPALNLRKKAGSDSTSHPQPLPLSSRAPEAKSTTLIVPPQHPGRRPSIDEARTPSPRLQQSPSPSNSYNTPPAVRSPPLIGPYRMSPSTSSMDGNASSPDLETVKLKPPTLDFQKPPSQQWEQYGITSSRPERAWDRCPRWTCCTCGAETIVEQIVCANLECLHDRCGHRCAVLRVPRKMSVFGRV